MKEVIYKKERYKGKTIIVHVNGHGFFTTRYTGKETYSYSSDAIIDAKKKIRKMDLAR
jgi:hypothetical protein